MNCVIEKENCTGCSACYSTCPVKSITMREDREGFLYPEIDEDICIGCGRCQQICPVKKSAFEKTTYFPEAFLAKHREKKVRISAASGGVFTALAIEFIEKHQGVVFGATYDKDFEVYHTFADTVDGVRLFSKSKYVQSRLDDTFQQVLKFLKQGRYVLFSGTPCQVYGLKSFLKQDFEKLYCIDVICHGVPSPKVFRKYQDWHQKQHGQIECITIRDKKLCRNFYRSGFGVEFKNGYHYFMSSDEDLMGRVFWGEISSRPSCYHCTFKSVWRESDLTLGDCWFAEELAKVEDADGITLVLAQSEKGLQMLKNSDCLELYAVDSEKAIKVNGGMIYSSAKQNPRRTEFFAELDSCELDALADKYLKQKKKRALKMVSSLKNIGIIPKSFSDLKKKKRFASRIKRTIPSEALGKVKLR